MEHMGKHLILDIWGAVGSLPFWQMDEASAALKQACIDAGATVLTERWHHFGEGFGYTGVIVLAESHCSSHSWPEHGYVAIDMFMCGDADPILVIPGIKRFYKPHRMETTLLERGKK